MEREGGMVFIESLAELLRRLMDYREVQQGDRDLHMHVMFNLLVSQYKDKVHWCMFHQNLKICIYGVFGS